MDPRLADRRRRVAEDRARSNVTRLIRFLVVLAPLAALVWFIQSPFLSVAEIQVNGANQVDVGSVLATHGVVEGRAMISLDLSAPERVLAANPWVSEVSLSRDWPRTVRVEVVERTPAVNGRFSNGWSLLAADAVILERVDAPRADLPSAEFDGVAARDATDSLEVAGAVEFLSTLPTSLGRGALVRRGTDGLEGIVAGFTVRLGGPFEMSSKAAVTAALIETELEEGSILTVVAPASPAVLPPGAGDGADQDTADNDELGEETNDDDAES